MPHLTAAKADIDCLPLQLELYFYELAHLPERRAHALAEIDRLLDEGVRSPGWDFSDNVNSSYLTDPEDQETLRRLANQISQTPAD
jgi:hypothetical protein